MFIWRPILCACFFIWIYPPLSYYPFLIWNQLIITIIKCLTPHRHIFCRSTSKPRSIPLCSKQHWVNRCVYKIDCKVFITIHRFTKFGDISFQYATISFNFVKTYFPFAHAFDWNILCMTYFFNVNIWLISTDFFLIRTNKLSINCVVIMVWTCPIIVSELRVVRVGEATWLNVLWFIWEQIRMIFRTYTIIMSIENTFSTWHIRVRRNWIRAPCKRNQRNSKKK